MRFNLKKLREIFPRFIPYPRRVSLMTFELRQEVFITAVRNDDMETMRKLLDLQDKRTKREISNE